MAALLSWSSFASRFFFTKGFFGGGNGSVVSDMSFRSRDSGGGLSISFENIIESVPSSFDERQILTGPPRSHTNFVTIIFGLLFSEFLANLINAHPVPTPTADMENGKSKSDSLSAAE